MNKNSFLIYLQQNIKIIQQTKDRLSEDLGKAKRKTQILFFTHTSIMLNWQNFLNNKDVNALGYIIWQMLFEQLEPVTKMTRL
jgi:hypothetical protein